MVKPGDKIRLLRMVEDPNPVEPGTTGTVTHITDLRTGEFQIGVHWDNGRTLSLITPVDKYVVIR